MFIVIPTLLHKSAPLIWDYNEEKNFLKWTSKTAQSKKQLSQEEKQEVFKILEQKENILIQEGTAFILNASSFLAKVKHIEALESRKKSYRRVDKDQIPEQRKLTLEALSKDSTLWGLTECYNKYFFDKKEEEEIKQKNLLLKTPASFIRELTAENNIRVHEIKRKINDYVREILEIIDLAYQNSNEISEDAHKKLFVYFQDLISKIMQYEISYEDYQSTRKRSNFKFFVKQPNHISLFVDQLLKPLSFFADPTLNSENFLFDKGLEYNLSLLESHLKKNNSQLNEKIVDLKGLMVQVLSTKIPFQEEVNSLNKKIAKKSKEVKGFSSFLSLLTANCSLAKNEANEALVEVIRAMKDFYNSNKEIAVNYLGTLTGGEDDFYLSPKWAEKLAVKLRDKDKTTISDCVIDFIKENLPLPQIEDINMSEDLVINDQSLLPGSGF